MVLFASPAAPAAVIVGSDDDFPVRRIFCVGRNYAEHTREMGYDPEREAPFFFTKFAESVVPSGSDIPYPPGTRDYQFEAELVVAIGRSGQARTQDEALAMVFGYAAGLDMTRRDLQQEARAKGRPWDMGKNFERSAPLAPLHRVEDGGHRASGPITLTVNGELKQSADLSDLIWSVPEIIMHLCSYGGLEPGDLIFTGTPAGVGPVKSGDRIEVKVADLTPLAVRIVDAAQ